MAQGGSEGQAWSGASWVPPPPPSGPETEPLSVWSLVLGVVSLIIPVLIGGIAAIITGSRAKAAIDSSGRRRSGRGMAVAGQILGVINLAESVGLVILFSLAAVFISHHHEYTTLHQGDCFDRNSGVFSHLVTRKSCSRPHQAEVVGTFDAPEGTWPGAGGIAAMANSQCQASARQYGILARPDLQLWWIYPSRGTWGHGTRTIVCTLRNADGTKRTGSLRGRAATVTVA
ncbi:MAG TPA: DUF4190 domain-containing protein [Acidimicrobiales bacterium]